MSQEVRYSPIKTNKKGQKYLFFPLILMAVLSLVSCSNQVQKSSAPDESYPSAAPSEHNLDYPKKSAVPDEHYPVYPKMAAPGERYPETMAEALAPAPKEISAPAPAIEEETSASTRAETTTTSPVILTTARHESPTNTFDIYRVVLGADEQLKIPGIPGELRVWIGDPAYQPDMPEEMTRTQTTLRAAGEWAKIEPYSPAFTIEPKGTPCIKIHPSGSEVRFQLTPRKAGTFEVGATVYLYNTPDCSGAPIPKIAANLKVTVKVDTTGVVQEKGKELWEIFWEQLLEFWAALLVILFGLVLFLIRGKLKKWFGYDKD